MHVGTRRANVPQGRRDPCAKCERRARGMHCKMPEGRQRYTGVRALALNLVAQIWLRFTHSSSQDGGRDTPAKLAATIFFLAHREIMQDLSTWGERG